MKGGQHLNSCHDNGTSRLKMCYPASAVHREGGTPDVYFKTRNQASVPQEKTTTLDAARVWAARSWPPQAPVAVPRFPLVSPCPGPRDTGFVPAGTARKSGRIWRSPGLPDTEKPDARQKASRSPEEPLDLSVGKVVSPDVVVSENVHKTNGQNCQESAEPAPVCTVEKPKPANDWDPARAVLAVKPVPNLEVPRPVVPLAPPVPSMVSAVMPPVVMHGFLPGVVSELPPNPGFGNASSHWMSPAPPTLATLQAGPRMKETAVYEHKMLLVEFQDVLHQFGKEAACDVQKLQQTYKKDIDYVEVCRHRALHQHLMGSRREMNQMTFDAQRLSLTRQMRAQLALEKQKLGQTGEGSVTPSSGSEEKMPPLRHISPTSSESGSCSMPSPVLPSPSKPCKDATKKSPPKRKFLSSHAVSLLSQWYQENYDLPYADDRTVDELSVQAGITTHQCIKWMANKRVRTNNTLAFNGSIHPKKLRKMMQLQEGGSTDSPAKPKAEVRKSRKFLDPAAVKYMNAWYSEHQQYPYPSNQEKQEIAEKTGLAVPQVTCWFANKRNRNNNTRKLSPGRMIQKLQRKLEIYKTMQQAKGEADQSGVAPMVKTESDCLNE